MRKIHILMTAAVFSGLMFSSCWRNEVNGYYFLTDDGEITTILPMTEYSLVLEYGESRDAIFARPEMQFKLVGRTPNQENRDVSAEHFRIEYYRDCNNGKKKIDTIKPIPDWGYYEIQYIPNDMPEWKMTISFVVEASLKPFYNLGNMTKHSWAQDENPPAPPEIINFSGTLPRVSYYYMSVETWNKATEEVKADPESWWGEGLVSEYPRYNTELGGYPSREIEPGTYYLLGYVDYPHPSGDTEYPDVNYYGYTQITGSCQFTVTEAANP